MANPPASGASRGSSNSQSTKKNDSRASSVAPSGAGSSTRSKSSVEPTNLASSDGDAGILQKLVTGIKTLDNAKSWLEKTKLRSDWQDGSIEADFSCARTAILHLAAFTRQQMPVVSESLVAFSFWLEDIQRRAAAPDTWANRAHSAFGMTDALRQQIGAATYDAVAACLTGSDDTSKPALLEIIDESVSRQCNLLSGMISAEALRTRERVDGAQKAVLDCVASLPTSTLPKSYSEAVLGPALRQNRFDGRSHEEQDAIARAEIQERQILIDPLPETAAAWADNKPPELVAKANIAIEAVLKTHPLSDDDPLKGEGKLKCLSVSKLRNRGVLFNLNSREAAD